MQVKVGDVITFADATAIAHPSDKEPARIVAGMVNGEPLTINGETLVPVWCNREGREPTTVYVNSRNIIQK
jgi:hypothetical protein